MKELLTEVYRTTKKISGVDPSKPGNMKAVLVDDAAFEAYVTGLAESIENKKDRAQFTQLAENTRINLLENSMFQINPYETLTLPILRVFYPKLVAKELVTVSPMDKPETVKAFVKAQFTASNSSTRHDAPVTNTDISRGVAFGTPIAATFAVPSSGYDVLGTAGLTSTEAHLERDFEITGVSSDGTAWVDVSIVPAVEGHFSASVTIGGSSDVVSGKVDYLAGTVDISSTTGTVSYARYQVTTSLEENRINPSVTLNVDKIRLYARDRQISANWTINMEQDMRALFDISMQAEIVNILGQQVALDIDREIINALTTANTRLNDASHRGSFNKTPPVTYTWGTKYWHENIIPELNALSGQIYTDTNIEAGNVIAANPLDVAILEDLQTFNYTGTSSVDGDLGYRSATVAGGKWKILTSAVVPQGQMLMVYKPVEELKAIYFYSPYVPAVLHPYPLGYTPSLTILSRYATALVRSAGIATLTIGA
ncbi:MAG: hypothetical protein K9L62_10835 [Vallitaleaceae bacterium]|nr:hypothetical protein [Vallitaleaceae bacterium]